MKRTLFLLLLACLFTGFSASAQTDWDDISFDNFTIEEADYPMPGDTLSEYFLVPDENDITDQLSIYGEDVSWDFTDLIEYAGLDSMVTIYYSLEDEEADLVYDNMDQDEFDVALDSLFSQHPELALSGEPDPDQFMLKRISYYEDGDEVAAQYFFQVWIEDEEDSDYEILHNFCEVYADEIQTLTYAYEEPEIDYDPEDLEDQMADFDDQDEEPEYSFDFEELDFDEDGTADYYIFEVSYTTFNVDGYGELIVPDPEDDEYVYVFPTVRLVEADSVIYFGTDDEIIAEDIFDALWYNDETYIEDYEPEVDFDYLAAAVDPLQLFTWYGFFENEGGDIDFGELASFQGYDEQALEDIFGASKSGKPLKAGASKGLKLTKNTGKKESTNSIRMAKAQMISDLNVYPVPATDVLHIDFTAKGEAVYTAEIIDMKGASIRRLALTASRNTLSLEGIKSGAYSLIIRNDTQPVGLKTFVVK